MASIEVLSAALRSLAAPGMSPKALRAAVLEKHPEASKKDIVRAAFHALIEAQSQESFAVETLHSFALAERASVDHEPVPVAPRRTRRHRRVADLVAATVAEAVAVAI